MTCGILVPWLGIEPMSPHPLHWKVVSPGPPGKSRLGVLIVLRCRETPKHTAIPAPSFWVQTEHASDETSHCRGHATEINFRHNRKMWERRIRWFWLSLLFECKSNSGAKTGAENAREGDLRTLSVRQGLTLWQRVGPHRGEALFAAGKRCMCCPGHAQLSPAGCLAHSRGSINTISFPSFSWWNRYEFFFFFYLPDTRYHQVIKPREAHGKKPDLESSCPRQSNY